MPIDNCAIKRLRLRNFLSFGNETTDVEFRPLNVLIGPNGSGKSNLLEALGLFRAATTDIADYIREGGGAEEWIWKGESQHSTGSLVEAVVAYPDGIKPLRHMIEFTAVSQRFEMLDESIENESKIHNDQPDVFFFYRYQRGKPVLSVRTGTDDPAMHDMGRTKRELQREQLPPDKSVLSERKDSDLYPELTYLSKLYSRIQFFKDWSFGRNNASRKLQRADLPDDFLLEDLSNLGLVLNHLEHAGALSLVQENLRHFGANFADIRIRVTSGNVQVHLKEEGIHTAIPATRLSDGTLRYLCLLAILLHPSPPPIICIEEPELGLHPDVLPRVAELLIQASQRTQLFVTTHSDTMVDALSEAPESVVVCEKHSGCTSVRRLDKQSLGAWLEEYSLGQLWRKGEIGGNRW